MEKREGEKERAQMKG